MKISPEKFEQLLRFLDAEMSAGEIAAFEQEVKTDPELKEQLDFQVKLAGSFPAKTSTEFEGIENDMALRSLLIGAKNKFLSPADDKKLSPVIKMDTGAMAVNHHRHHSSGNIERWLAAASVIALALIASLVYYSGKNNGNDDFTATGDDTIKPIQKNIVIVNPADTIHKQLINDPSTQRINYASIADENYTKDKGPSDPPQLLAEVMSDYNRGDYTGIQAMDVNNIPKVRGEIDELMIKGLGHYYKGLSFIETKNNEKARLDLQWVVDSANDESLKIKASWYQSLVYLKTGDVKKAQFLLTQVVSNKKEPFYNKKALTLLKKINGPE